MQEVIYKLPTHGSTLNSYIFKESANIFSKNNNFIKQPSSVSKQLLRHLTERFSCTRIVFLAYFLLQHRGIFHMKPPSLKQYQIIIIY